LHIWSRLCSCISPQKLFLLLSFTYSRTSRIKLGDADTFQTYL
jgi:hypothetical protein